MGHFNRTIFIHHNYDLTKNGLYALLHEVGHSLQPPTSVGSNSYKNFVIKRGINTISSVYKLLLIYTKNLNYTSFNCEKASSYYIEFIGQISDDNHSFLELNSKLLQSNPCQASLYKCIYVLWNQLHYSTKELTKLVSNEDLKFENGGKCNFVTSSYFLSTARPRDTRILVPEKNRATQNRAS